MVFKNPNAKIVYPKTGDYTDKLDYIANEGFKVFDYKISFTLPETEIITYADVGTTVNFANRSMVIYTGSGDVNLLFKECKSQNPILICANNLEQELSYKLSDCIVSGSDDAKTIIGEALKKQNIDFRTVDSETISIDF